jgi:hypothetical protein
MLAVPKYNSVKQVITKKKYAKAIITIAIVLRNHRQIFKMI